MDEQQKPTVPPITLFYSYAHEDELLRNQLEKHLSLLRRQGLITEWHDRQILAGEEWARDIDQHLETASIILLLISPDFLASDYCYNIEMQRAVELHRCGEARVIPIILRPVDWHGAPFGQLQCLPRDGKPVKEWSNQDAAFRNIAQGLRRTIERFTGYHEIKQGGDTPSIPLILRQTDWSDDQFIELSELPNDERPITELRLDNQVPFQAIEPPGVFIGRDSDCALIEKELRSGRKVVIIRGGLGGEGKTSLAAYIAHRMHNLFPDGVLWARVDTDETRATLVSFIESFGLHSVARLRYLSTDIARANYYHSLLSQKRCLIVLDNAESAEQVIPLLPLESFSQVLITTRYSLSGAIPDSYEHYLKVLSPLASMDLFTVLLDGPLSLTNIKSLEILLSELGYLPLAIRITVGIIRDLNWMIDDYLLRFQESSTLDWVSIEDDSISIRRSFAVSYNSLPNEMIKKTFRTLGIFQQQSILGAVVAPIIGCTLDQVERSILILVRRGLIEVGMGEQHGILIHPLMKRYMNELLSQHGEAQVAHTGAGQWYRNHISFWDSHQQQFQYGVLGTEEDVTMGLTAVFHYYQAKLYDQAQQILIAIADMVTLQGREDALLKHLDNLARITPLLPWLQFYRGHLLITMKDKGNRTEGESILQSLTRSDDLKIASAALISLAKAKLAAHQFKDAQHLLQESRGLKEHLNPPDIKGIAFILNQLAIISRHNEGDYSGALEKHHQALTMQRQISDVKGMAYTLRRIATIYLRHLNETERALEALSEGEALAKQAESKLVLISILIEKAEALGRLQYYSSAVDNLQDALQLARKCDDSFPEAQVLKRLAVIYERIEFYGAALQCLERSKVIFAEVDLEQTADLEITLKRIRTKTKTLEEELRQTEKRIQELELGENYNKAELRIQRRKCKRLRQKLGLEAALIRLGKK